MRTTASDFLIPWAVLEVMEGPADGVRLKAVQPPTTAAQVWIAVATWLARSQNRPRVHPRPDYPSCLRGRKVPILRPD